MNKHLNLNYREQFKLNTIKEINRVKRAGVLTKTELRILNVITSMTKSENSFTLHDSIALTNEKNKDIVIEAVESLISRKIILPNPQ